MRSRLFGWQTGCSGSEFSLETFDCRLLERRYVSARIGGGLSRLLRIKRPPGIGIVITLT